MAAGRDWPAVGFRLMLPSILFILKLFIAPVFRGCPAYPGPCDAACRSVVSGFGVGAKQSSIGSGRGGLRRIE